LKKRSFLLYSSYLFNHHLIYPMSQKISLEDIQTRVSAIYTETQKRVIGQDILIRNILIALFSGGHILLE